MTVRLPRALTRDALTVRLWELSDAAAMDAAIRGNLEWLRPWMPWIPQEPLPISARRELIIGWGEQFDAGLDATYGLFLDGDIVGGAGLHQRIGPGGLEIGYWVSEHAARRRVALTTAALLTAAALSAAGVERVEIHHAAENARSEAIPRALGYRRIATERREPLAQGLSGDLVIWRITELDATPHLVARWAGHRVRPDTDTDPTDVLSG